MTVTTQIKFNTESTLAAKIRRFPAPIETPGLRSFCFQKCLVITCINHKVDSILISLVMKTTKHKGHKVSSCVYYTYKKTET